MKEKEELLELIAEVKKGSPVSQRDLVNLYSDYLFAISLRYMSDQENAKDVLQDSFIKIFRSIKNFNPEKGAIKSWMGKIVINTALKAIDKRKLRNSFTEFFNNPIIAPTAESELNAFDLFEIIRELPDGYRQVFNLYEIEGYSHKEIASMLGIKEVSSRSNLTRAKAILRQRIALLNQQESLA